MRFLKFLGDVIFLILCLCGIGIPLLMFMEAMGWMEPDDERPD